MRRGEVASSAKVIRGHAQLGTQLRRLRPSRRRSRDQVLRNPKYWQGGRMVSRLESALRLTVDSH